MFGVDVRVFADPEVGRRLSSGVGSTGVPLLSASELFLEHFLNFEDVDSEIASEDRRDLSFGKDSDVRMVAFGSEERGNAS